MKIQHNFFLQEKKIKSIIEYILNIVKSHSAEAEVLAYHNSGINLGIRNKIIDHVEFNKDNLITITIYKKNRKSTVSSKNFSIQAINKIINFSIDAINYASVDLCVGLPNLELLAIGNLKDLNLYYHWKWDINYIVDLMLVAEQEAFKIDKRIINTEGFNFKSCMNMICFGNSSGMLESYKTTSYYFSNCMIAKENKDMQRDMFYTISRDINDLVVPNIVGIESSNRALSRLHSQKLSSMNSPIIFSSELASEFFSYFSKAINGFNVYNKSTFLLDSLEKQVFPSWLSIEEHPHIKKGLGSRCFDSEGVRTFQKTIVKNGILKTWILNNYSAKKMNLVSTSNAGGVHNWLMLGISDMNLNELLMSMYKGVLITELLGNGLNLITGDYSCGAVGFWIERGTIQYPVSEITISGNLKDIFRNIVSIGNDIDKRHKILSGSILLPSIQISGL
ncbi:MAG: metalloprotease PmbA [Buchnera aphidicola (Nurudea yanoniella)]